MTNVKLAAVEMLIKQMPFNLRGNASCNQRRNTHSIIRAYVCLVLFTYTRYTSTATNLKVNTQFFDRIDRHGYVMGQSHITAIQYDHVSRTNV